MIRLLIKFGSKKNMKELFHDGAIYFSQLEEFRIHKNSKNRDDESEGTISIRKFDPKNKTILTINPNQENSINLKITKGKFIEKFTNLRVWNYSLYSILNKEIFKKDYFIDKKMISDEKYQYCVIFTNPNEFLRRVKKELDILNLTYRSKKVKYYNENKNQSKLDLFNKPSKFNHQNEYRIIIYNHNLKDQKIYIGNISDIALIYKSEFLERITIS